LRTHKLLHPIDQTFGDQTRLPSIQTKIRISLDLSPTETRDNAIKTIFPNFAEPGQLAILAIAVRFVSDSIYTERYMGLPTAEDNLAGYNRTDISRRVDGIYGKKFMLIHGTGDDNVHYQQAMALAKALEQEDILFQQVSYTDEAHSLQHVYPHFYHTMDKFWDECFGLTR
jgi:hypothetical protein